MLNEKELNELDAWIAENVMKLRPHPLAGDWYYLPNMSVGEFRPHRNRAQALEVLEKCSMVCDLWGIEIFPPNSEVSLHWTVRQPHNEPTPNPIIHEANTLPIAICLFAKELFQKGR